MTSLVITILVFLGIGIVFLAANLLLGRLIRPNKPNASKLEIYECGEQPVGSSWIQFDLRFYVIALLFIVFDVEIAFLFPWGAVFGTATTLSQENLPAEQRIAVMQQLDPHATAAPSPQAAAAFSEFAFLELIVFFGILLVGFAYLWSRGDLEWVRSVAGQVTADGHLPQAG